MKGGLIRGFLILFIFKGKLCVAVETVNDLLIPIPFAGADHVNQNSEGNLQGELTFAREITFIKRRITL